MSEQTGNGLKNDLYRLAWKICGSFSPRSGTSRCFVPMSGIVQYMNSLDNSLMLKAHW